MNGVIGRIYKIKVRAINYAGFVETNAISVALASLPSKPSIPPTSNPQITNQNTLGVFIELFTNENNGGSEIFNYEI